jgi:hypothetical protein
MRSYTRFISFLSRSILILSRFTPSPSKNRMDVNHIVSETITSIRLDTMDTPIVPRTMTVKNMAGEMISLEASDVETFKQMYAEQYVEEDIRPWARVHVEDECVWVDLLDLPTWLPSLSEITTDPWKYMIKWLNGNPHPIVIQWLTDHPEHQHVEWLMKNTEAVHLFHHLLSEPLRDPDNCANLYMNRSPHIVERFLRLFPQQELTPRNLYKISRNPAHLHFYADKIISDCHHDTPLRDRMAYLCEEEEVTRLFHAPLWKSQEEKIASFVKNPYAYRCLSEIGVEIPWHTRLRDRNSPRSVVEYALSVYQSLPSVNTDPPPKDVVFYLPPPENITCKPHFIRSIGGYIVAHRYAVWFLSSLEEMERKRFIQSHMCILLQNPALFRSM